MAREITDPTDAMVRFLVVLTGAVGVALLAWLLVIIAAMVTTTVAAGIGGVSLSIKLARKGK